MVQSWPVQKYDKKIKYLDYMENGMRSRGVGFVKMEQKDNKCSFSLQISGLYRKDHFTRPLLLLDGTGERELCRIQLADGGSKACLERLNCQNLDGQGLNYEQVIGLRIPISEGKEIRCLWGEQKESGGDVQPEVEPQTVLRDESVWEVQNVPAFSVDETMAETLTQPAAEARAETTVQPATQFAAETPTQTTVQTDAQPSASVELHEDKWTQLWAIYPHIKPFEDGREYLSMGPGDFVILPGQYYRMVNNSFLLHGYYNYGHLIMARVVEERNRAKYYIGVPGNYYEKEKKVAIMFGFVSFEGATENAEEGDFGYYMIPVDL